MIPRNRDLQENSETVILILATVHESCEREAVWVGIMLRPWRKLGRDRLGDKTKQINIQNNQPQRQDTPQTGPDSAADMGLEYSWSHCPRGLSPPGQVLGNARSGGDATREKRRGKNLSLSELDCMSPESCSKVLIAAKLRLNNGC